MIVSEEFKKIIDEDIEKCEYEIRQGNKQSRGVLHNTLKSKYCKIIDGFDENLKSLSYDDSGEYRKQNLETMKQKLVLFKAMGYQNSYSEISSGITVNNNNSVSNVINVTFEETRRKIENMSALTEEEIEEILTKLKEIETVSKTDERKSKKWDKMRPILVWLADRGADVGLAILPHILGFNG